MKCKICGKNMPPTVLEAHMKKSHTKKPKKPLKKKKVVKGTQREPKWEMGEMNTCRQCNEEWPSRLMELHMHVRHGM